MYVVSDSFLKLPCFISDDEDPHYTASFSAEAHLQHFETTLAMYGHSVKSFVHSLLGDNCSVNIKVANDAGLPFLSCHNHGFALDISDYRKTEPLMKVVGDKCREILKVVKASCVERSLLGRLTPIRPKVVKSCKWTAEHTSIDNFNQLFDPVSLSLTIC